VINADAKPIGSSILQLTVDYGSGLEKDENGNKHTVRAYTREVKEFSESLVKKCGEAYTVTDISESDILNHLNDLVTRGLSVPSRARALSAIRTWFDCLARAGLLQRNVAKHVPTPKGPLHVPDILDVKSTNAMVDAAGTLDVPWPARDRAIVESIYDFGISNHELTGMDLVDIHWEEMEIVVRGRGGKQRLVPMCDAAAKALRAYLDERSKMLGIVDQTPALFLNMQLRGLRKHGNEARLTTRSVGRIVKRIAVLSKLSDFVDMHPRTLLWSFGAHMLDSGAPLKVVQGLMGTVSESTADKLKRLAPSRLQNVMDRTHPRGTPKPAVEKVELLPTVASAPKVESARKVEPRPKSVGHVNGPPQPNRRQHRVSLACRGIQQMLRMTTYSVGPWVNSRGARLGQVAKLWIGMGNYHEANASASF